MQSGWGGETAFSTVTENAQRHGRFHVRRPESAVVTYREPMRTNKIRWFQPQEEERSPRLRQRKPPEALDRLRQHPRAWEDLLSL